MVRGVRLHADGFESLRLQAGVVDGKPILLRIPERILPRLSVRVAPDRGEQIVDERQDAGRRPEADRNGPSWPAARPERFDETSRFVDERDIGVAEPVNRLLAIADDENRRRQRIVGGAEPFAPALDELPHQLPLRAARVLEFVQEHVPMPGLEPQPGFRELVEVPQQLQRSLEHSGKIDERVRLERPLILAERDGEDPPDTA